MFTQRVCFVLVLTFGFAISRQIRSVDQPLDDLINEITLNSDNNLINSDGDDTRQSSPNGPAKDILTGGGTLVGVGSGAAVGGMFQCLIFRFINVDIVK